jgi:hypothetical protein
MEKKAKDHSKYLILHFVAGLFLLNNFLEAFF